MQNARAAATTGEDEIIRQYDQRIRYTALPFVSRGVSLDDLIQEGRIALVAMARSWDGTLGVKLWTYARKRVFGAMVEFVTREIEEPCRDPQPIDEHGDGAPVHTLEDPGPSPEESASIAESLAILEEEICSISPEERALLWKIFGEDRDVRSIGDEMHMSKSAVDRLKQGAIAALRERLEARS